MKKIVLLGFDRQVHTFSGTKRPGQTRQQNEELSTRKKQFPPLPDETTGRGPTVITAGARAKPELERRDVALVGIKAKYAKGSSAKHGRSPLPLPAQRQVGVSLNMLLTRLQKAGREASRAESEFPPPFLLTL